MKNIVILGSTGSIGQSTLSVIRNFPGKFRVIGLSVNSDIENLYKQVKEFQPPCVCIRDKKAAFDFTKKVKGKVKIFVEEEGLCEFVKDRRIERIMFAISGSAAFEPLISAIEAGKDIALANKEALVMAGPIIMRIARKHKAKILPVDSEQSAIWQCLQGEDKSKLRKVYLTASGGPLRKIGKNNLKGISLKMVLKHPRWKMGKKITVDSATLMNKGLELLEAMFLFNLPFEMIKVLIHPEALIHSMIEFEDGSIKAQLSVTDMRIPIQYALAYPERLVNRDGKIDFYKLGSLNFEKPDLIKFPCLKLAYQVAQDLGTAPCVLNAANEVAVNEFLMQRIKFVQIPKIIERVIRGHANKCDPCLDDIRQADIWAKNEASRVIERLN